MNDEVGVSFRCDVCDKKIEWPDDAIDTTPIICKCGKQFGTYADLRHTALEAVKGRVESMFKDAFKRR